MNDCKRVYARGTLREARPIRYTVRHRGGELIGTYRSARAAYRAAERLDAAYGAVAYTVKQET